MTTELVKNRKDARKLFEEDKPIIVNCKTSASEFNASIQDISGSGIFLKTTNPLSIGQEIAMTFKFPKALKPIMVTGEVVRTTRSGVAVEFKVFFDK
jgi:Tfp pilus assembly protein PilZ